METYDSRLSLLSFHQPFTDSLLFLLVSSLSSISSFSSLLDIFFLLFMEKLFQLCHKCRLRPFVNVCPDSHFQIITPSSSSLLLFFFHKRRHERTQLQKLELTTTDIGHDWMKRERGQIFGIFVKASSMTLLSTTLLSTTLLSITLLSTTLLS